MPTCNHNLSLFTAHNASLLYCDIAAIDPRTVWIEASEAQLYTGWCISDGTHTHAILIYTTGRGPVLVLNTRIVAQEADISTTAHCHSLGERSESCSMEKRDKNYTLRGFREHSHESSAVLVVLLQVTFGRLFAMVSDSVSAYVHVHVHVRTFTHWHVKSSGTRRYCAWKGAHGYRD